MARVSGKRISCLIIALIILVLFSSFASGSLVAYDCSTNEHDFDHCWEGDSLTDSISGVAMTEQGNGNCSVGNNESVIEGGSSFWCDGVDNNYFDMNFKDLDTAGNFTIILMAKLTDDVDDNDVLIGSSTDPTTFIGVNPTSDYYFRFTKSYTEGGSSTKATNFSSAEAGGWYCVAATSNGSVGGGFANMHIQVNGTTPPTVFTQNDGGLNGGKLTEDLSLFARGSTLEFQGYIQQVLIANRTWKNQSVINEICTTVYSAPSGLSILNVTITYPTNGTNYNSERIEANSSRIWINATVNETGITAWSINDSRFTLNSNTSTTATWLNNTAIGKGTYHINVTANKSASTNGYATVRFYVDLVSPSIEHNFTNGTIVYRSNLTANFNFTDDFALWSFNISIDGVTIDNKTGLTSTSYSYNLSHNVSGYSIGNHTLKIRLADGHTAEYIEPYEVGYGLLDNYIKYTFKNKNYIKIGAGLLDKWETKKLHDRYTFGIKPFSKSKKYNLVIESNKEIHIINAPNTKWKKWIIVDGHWIDFLNDADGEIKLNKINEYRVEVEIKLNKNLKKEKINFNSIGDLNVVENEFTFNNVNVSTTEQALVLEKEMTTFTLNITKNNGDISTTAAFIYNGENREPTKTATNYSDYYFIGLYHDPSTNYSTDFNYNWSFNITGATTDEYQINGTNKLYKMIAGLCNTTLNETALNITVKDERLDTNIYLYDFESTITVFNLDNTSFTRSYPISESDKNISNRVCIYPYFANLSSNFDMLFTRTGYESNNYIEAGYLLNSTTIFKTLYMVNSSLDTAITVTIVDENDDALVNYIVEAHKYDLGANSYSLISSEYADSDGQVVFNLDVSTYEYQFIIKNPSGDTVRTISKQKLTKTEYTFQIVIGTTPSLISLKLNALDISLQKDRAKKNFNLTWSNIGYASNDIKLDILRVNSTNGTRKISSQVSTADSGFLGYYIAEDTNNVSISFVANVYVNSSEDGVYYFIVSESIDFRKEWDIYGAVESVVISFIFVGTFIFLGIAFGAEAAIICAIAGLLLSFFAGMIMVSLTALSGLIVGLIVLLVRIRRR